MTLQERQGPTKVTKLIRTKKKRQPTTVARGRTEPIRKRIRSPVCWTTPGTNAHRNRNKKPTKKSLREIAAAQINLELEPPEGKAKERGNCTGEG